MYIYLSFLSHAVPGLCDSKKHVFKRFFGYCPFVTPFLAKSEWIIASSIVEQKYIISIKEKVIFFTSENSDKKDKSVFLSFFLISRCFFAFLLSGDRRDRLVVKGH